MWRATPSRSSFSERYLYLYSSSLSMDEKNDSATELSYGKPGLENDWVTPRSARKARKVQER